MLLNSLFLSYTNPLDYISDFVTKKLL